MRACLHFHGYIYIYLSLFGLEPLAGRILGGLIIYYQLEVQLAYLVDFAQFYNGLSTFYFSVFQVVVSHSLESLFT